jgi:hypothetical protein
MALSDRVNSVTSIAASSSNQSGLNVQASLAPPLPASQQLNAAAVAVVQNPQNPALALVCALDGMEGNEQTSFDLWASGIVTTLNASNIVGKLAVGTSLTDATNVALGSSGANAVGTTTAPWRVHAELIYDSVSGKLHGTCEWLINNILTTKAALATVATGMKDTNSPVANFVLSFSSSAATVPLPTTVVVKKFSVG